MDIPVRLFVIPVRFFLARDCWTGMSNVRVFCSWLIVHHRTLVGVKGGCRVVLLKLT